MQETLFSVNVNKQFPLATLNYILVFNILLALPPMSQFTNKIIWITGATSGIGEALAYALSEQGAKLVSVCKTG